MLKFRRNPIKVKYKLVTKKPGFQEFQERSRGEEEEGRKVFFRGKIQAFLNVM